MDTNNLDKLFRDAAEKPTGNFPVREKVWSRLEEKLEKRHLSKSKKRWKKIAVAASFLLCASLGFQVWQDNIDDVPSEIRLEQKSEIPKISKDDASIEPVETVPEAPAETEEEKENLVSPTVKADAEMIQGFTAPHASAVVSAPHVTALPTKQESIKEEASDQSIGFTKRIPQKGAMLRRTDLEAPEVSKSNPEQILKKEPLYVVNDIALTADSDKEYDRKKKTMIPSGVQLDSVYELKEPLYIINGVEYSEYELFGPKPSSPYYPLQNQQIEEIKIFQEPEAIRKFGPKGKKGVVVITTKNGKPFQK